MKISKDLWFNTFSSNPRTICELGTGGSTEVFQCKNFLDLKDSKFILVEVNPASFSIVKSNFGDKDNFSLYNKAICDENKIIKFYNRFGIDAENACGYIEGAISPVVIKHGEEVPIYEQSAINVEGIKFSEIDDGQIDILFCDLEGAEWYALKHMISEPKIISVETHAPDYFGARYVNSHINEIENYLKDKGYSLINRDDSDSLYFKK